MQVSLTSQLDQKDSSIRAWMDSTFPNTVAFIRRLNREQTSGIPLAVPTPLGVPLGSIGTAFDYRLWYLFAITPISDLVAYQGARRVTGGVIRHDDVEIEYPRSVETVSRAAVDGFFQQLMGALGRIGPIGSELSAPKETELARICLVLALFEEVSGLDCGRDPHY